MMKSKNTYTQAEIVTLLCDLGIYATTEAIMTNALNNNETTPEEYAYLNVAQTLSQVLVMLVGDESALQVIDGVKEYRVMRLEALVDLLNKDKLSSEVIEALHVPFSEALRNNS
jgi:hypothetical protein